MTIFRASASLLLGLICLLLASCIDGREEVWLNADGSGRADLHYDIPAAATRFHGGTAGVEALLASLLKDFPSSKHEIVQEGERLKVRVTLDFHSAAEISKLGSSAGGDGMPKSFEYLAGEFRIDRSLLGVDFTRTISPGKALPSAFIPPAELRGRKLTYILHLPIVPAESTASRTENGGKTQIWEQTLSAAMQRPVVVHFKARIPTPAWAVAMVCGIAIGCGALLVVAKRRRRRSKIPDPA